MDHSSEAFVGLVAAHGDTLEFLQTAEEVLDQVPPFVDLGVDRKRGPAVWALRDDDLGASFLQLVNDPVRVEGLVGDETVKLDALDQRRKTYRIVPVSGQQDEADQIAERIGQCQDFRG